MTTLARKLLSKARRELLGIGPVSDQPYASHLPVLMGLGRIHQVRRVLELGSGPFSTSLFLDREWFPHLESIESFEDDPDWLPIIKERVGSDPRLDLRLVDAVRLSVPQDLDAFDLIFVDDSRTAEERSHTIATVRDRARRSLVVIHDFEQRPYRRAARAFNHRTVFSTFTPQVGVCWNDSEVNAASLSTLKREIARGHRERGLGPADREGWAETLSSL